MSFRPKLMKSRKVQHPNNIELSILDANNAKLLEIQRARQMNP